MIRAERQLSDEDIHVSPSREDQAQEVRLQPVDWPIYRRLPV